MHPTVTDILANLGAGRQNLLLGPARNARQQRQRESFEAHVEVDTLPTANLLELRVEGPAVERPLELAVHDVDKAGLLQDRGVVGNTLDSAADLLRCFVERIVPLPDGRVFGHGAIIAAHWEGQIANFEVSSRSQVANTELGNIALPMPGDNSYS